MLSKWYNEEIKTAHVEKSHIGNSCIVKNIKKSDFSKSSTQSVCDDLCMRKL